jgi:hypothetical protein
MQTAHFPITSTIEATTVQDCASRLMRETGPMLACVWPELNAWLDELVPELAGDPPQNLTPDWRLTEQQRRRLLSPEFDTVYRISDAVNFSRLILAALRHSELSVVFAPADVSQGKFASLLRLADRTAFQPAERDKPLRAEWLLDVGSYEVDDKVVRIFTDKADRLAQLTELLAPLRLERTAPSEGHTS